MKGYREPGIIGENIMEELTSSKGTDRDRSTSYKKHFVPKR
jgi:hypothetical protein